ncbi:hypothetical protein Tco_1471932 [Tanacetum coccineum]
MHDWSLRNFSRELKVLGGLVRNLRPRNLLETRTFPPLNGRLWLYTLGYCHDKCCHRWLDNFAISDETAGGEEFVLTLETMALLRD